MPQDRAELWFEGGQVVAVGSMIDTPSEPWVRREMTRKSTCIDVQSPSSCW